MHVYTFVIVNFNVNLLYYVKSRFKNNVLRILWITLHYFVDL